MSDLFQLLVELRRRGFVLEENTADSIIIDGPEFLTEDDLDQAAKAIKPHRAWFAWILAIERISGRRVVGMTTCVRSGKRLFTFGV